MPSNIQHENISVAKLGIETISKGYIGHDQVYPNSTVIQSAAYTDTSSQSYLAGTRIFRVTGDVGSTYNLTNYGAGTYTLNSSPFDHSIAIPSNGSSPCYSGTQRTINTTLTPTGSTTLQGGGATFSSSLIQIGLTGVTSYTSTASVSIVPLNNAKTTVNGVTYWAAGATFRVTIVVPQNAGGYSYPVLNYRTNVSAIYNTWTGTDATIAGSAGGTASADYTTVQAGYSNISFVTATCSINSATCYSLSGSEPTVNLYP